MDFNVQTVYTQADVCDGLYVSIFIASPYSVYSSVYFYKCLIVSCIVMISLNVQRDCMCMHAKSKLVIILLRDCLANKT